ncbi:MAG: glycosyl hydrolase-related protein [Oscillospiraceae bacterium]|jgi:alpha-mannosidase|nr:glycosyl hydrolase-related protein [Oscillospiraceae bacterium]
MLNDAQIDRMLKKLRRFEEQLEPMIFEKADEIGFSAFQTIEQHHKIPGMSLFAPVEKGWRWGAECGYCWFKSSYAVPEALAGRQLFIRPHIEGYEAMLWVNGLPFGTFATKIVFTGHGNHYCDMLKQSASAGETIAIDLEYYAGHYCYGCSPFENNPQPSFNFLYNGADICVKNYEIQDFYFDLVTLNQMAKDMPKNSFRRGDVINALYEVHKTVYYSPEDTSRESFMDALKAASPAMKAALSVKTSDSAPFAGITGHSHMDTAWLWHVGETVKKCARTYANQLSLMEQYPEYRFIQSSACHSDFLLEHYPELFEAIKAKVKEGRYEPNGAVWVECDCNITSGESMVRQFLWGQRFTREHFDYTANCFWLPDTFGYSAAIPQIMKGCAVDYFLTTKIGWNDTNKFPYDTFYWQGLDGTKVFSHFNTTHHYPDAESLMDRLSGEGGGLKQKSVTDKRYLAYGFGDGGGGPQFEMIELARRCEDLDGVGRAKHMAVGEFMKDLEATAVHPNTYKGELYLELHRGTLTNQHTIKRNNRKAELALRDLEYITVNEAVKNKAVASSEQIAPLYKVLLLNQFHDILPGTCINRAHVESRAQTAKLIADARAGIAAVVNTSEENTVTLINTLSFARSDVQALTVPAGYIADGPYAQQRYTDLDGNDKLLIAGVKISAFGSVTLKLVKGEPEAASSFSATGSSLATPFASVVFDEAGRITSFIDTTANRELKGEGYPLNTFLVAEDVPCQWDNWDLDADIECKFHDTSVLLGREVISVGSVAYIIRSTYRITEKSTVTQDMIFFANSPEVRFDTAMDWNDDHRFLKTSFDTSIMEDMARQEIQFGYAKRPTTRNNSLEQAKFEVVNHKYTDLSETRYGVAVLNDCKYGITLDGGSLRLSLHKGGNRPDHFGDKDGIHRCVYSFLPHNSGFSAESVIRPAYELNIPAIATQGEYSSPALLEIDAANIIVESIKPCEDNEKAFIARLYEAEGVYTNVNVTFFDGALATEETNMLEETLRPLPSVSPAALTFRPFEIKTLKIKY